MELTISLSLMAFGVLGFFFAFYSNAVAVQSTDQRDEVRVALDRLTESIRNADHETLYSNYHGTSVEVPELEDPDGGPARATVTCFVNETTLPWEFGPVIDLDGKEGMKTTDCSTTYKLLPVRLTLSFVDRDVVQTRQVFLVVGDNK